MAMPGKEINVAETYEYIEVIPQLCAATHKIFRKPKGVRVDENGRH
jgi:hypothetical protein